MLTIEEHTRALRAIIQDTLSFCRADLFPDFCRLAEKVLDDRVPGSARPPWLMLPIFACEALEGDVTQAQHVAAALEIGRIAAGCLDEWQDHDTDDALWRTLGAERTVNLATAMIALSFLALNPLLDQGAPPDTVLRLKQEFELCLLYMSEGQHADLGDTLALESYESVAGAKSGALFGLGCRAGAIVAGAPQDVAALYGEFGHNLGVLIQIWNDFQGLVGVRGKTDAERSQALPALAVQGLPESALEPQTGGGPVGQLYALVRLQALHQRAAEALARCPDPGRLPLFLESCSPQRALNRAS